MARAVTLIGLVVLMGACTSERVQCGPCPPPVYVNIAGAALWSVRPTAARVCVGPECTELRLDLARSDRAPVEQVCVDIRRIAGCSASRTAQVIQLSFSTLRPASVAGADITVRLRGGSAPARTLRGVMRYSEPSGGGPCGCTYAAGLVEI